METDIGNPIEYIPDVEEPEQNQYYYPNDQTQVHVQPQPAQVQEQVKSADMFANIEKSTWIIAFAVFLLGFFMGKTMQPVILRYT
jgi:hypothetical protein